VATRLLSGVRASDDGIHRRVPGPTGGHAEPAARGRPTRGGGSGRDPGASPVGAGPAV